MKRVWRAFVWATVTVAIAVVLIVVVGALIRTIEAFALFMYRMAGDSEIAAGLVTLGIVAIISWVILFITNLIQEEDE